MAKRSAQDWEDLEQDLHAAGVSPDEIEAGARTLLAQARGHQLAEARKQAGITQRDIAATMGVSVARISQIEHGEVTSFDVIARYVEALGGRLDLVADFGDRTVRLPVTDTAVSSSRAASSDSGQPRTLPVARRARPPHRWL
jgi:transcriptional regulator with XRE-family HTH domain